MPRRNRALDQLKPLLDRQLTVYALAATAYFGGGPAIAKGEVVYTSVKQFGEGKIGAAALVPIDLNHDGMVDFTMVGVELSAFGTLAYLHTAVLYIEADGAGQGVPFGSVVFRPEAQAFKVGQKIGPSLDFVTLGRGGLVLGLITTFEGAGSHFGNFYNQRNQFLALKLPLNGETYYGWARVNVKVVNENFVFELVDYAYQDTPNKPILAGEGIPQANADLAPSLGLLTYGSDAIPAWRR